MGCNNVRTSHMVSCCHPGFCTLINMGMFISLLSGFGNVPLLEDIFGADKIKLFCNTCVMSKLVFANAITWWSLESHTQILKLHMFVCLMVFNATFNNISVISWQSVLLVEDLEKTTDLSQVTDKLYHIMLFTSPWSRFKLTTSVVIWTDCIGSCKSNHHTIMTPIWYKGEITIYMI